MNKNHIATCVALNDGKFTTQSFGGKYFTQQTSLASNVPAVVCVMLLFNANLPAWTWSEVLSAVLLSQASLYGRVCFITQVQLMLP